MVVQQHLAAARDAGQGKHRPGIAAGGDPNGADDPRVIERSDEADLPAPGDPDGRTHRCRRRGRQRHVGERNGIGMRRQVLRGFFFAAGKSTLLRISR
jgi:hypothetical protein